jgi:transcriptional regulator with GAF, ATPase, and Fis domain
MVGADLEVAADVGDDLVHEIGRRLKHAGVEAGSDQAGASARPVIFVCGKLRKEYDRCLAGWSRVQCRRVLVLSTAPRPPPPDSMWRVIGSVAEEVLHWDGTPATIEDIRGRLTRWRDIDALVGSAIVQSTVVGQSPALLAVLRQLVEAAHFTDDPILITGETGTGKEVAARLVHALDRKRKRKDLAIVDCGAIVPTLSGSEFFGHDRGAFTGAIEARDGAFALADGGILFLDEVGELPPDLQVQLLRVIQEKRYKRVGSNTWRDTDFRLLAATNRDLWAEVREHRFRRDLYYRLAVWPIVLPPLAERMEDVLPLAEHFLADGADGEGRPVLTAAVQAYLGYGRIWWMRLEVAYPW